MIILMKPDATDQQVRHVIERVEGLGFRTHLSRGQERVIIGVLGDVRRLNVESLETAQGVDRAMRILEPYKLVSRSAHPEGTTVPVGDGISVGGRALFIAAGPCSVETHEQIQHAARAVKAAGASALRGGAFKPRSSPYSFQGLGEPGLGMLAAAARENGLALVTEVMSPEQIPLVAEHADMLQVGARNMQNYELLKALGRVQKPVLLKRGLSATVTELLLSAEYIVQAGNPLVVLCERGIRTFETATRNTLDLNAVALLKEKTHLPVIVDPSHATGVRSLVPAAAKAAIGAGADGLLIEVHPDPESALSDGAQSLAPEEFAALMLDLQGYAELEGRTLQPTTGVRAYRAISAHPEAEAADADENGWRPDAEVWSSSSRSDARAGVSDVPERRFRKQPGEMSQLRRRIEQLDDEILRAAAERTRLASSIGNRQPGSGQLSDDILEEEALATARAQAGDFGLSADLAEKLITLLIRETVTSKNHQHEPQARNV